MADLKKQTIHVGTVNSLKSSSCPNTRSLNINLAAIKPVINFLQVG